MTELEDDLGLPGGKAILVLDAPPQDEAVVIEAEARCVEEEDLADLGPWGCRFVRALHVVLLGGAGHELPVLAETLRRGEAVWPQEDLALLGTAPRTRASHPCTSRP